jgi:hypothetical protein
MAPLLQLIKLIEKNCSLTIMKNSVLKVHPKDNVLVALKNLAKGENR